MMKKKTPDSMQVGINTRQFPPTSENKVPSMAAMGCVFVVVFERAIIKQFRRKYSFIS